MRYIILGEFKSEWPQRKEYIECTVNLWFYATHKKNMTELTSIPSTSDILFIIGHNNEVYDYLSKHISTIHEPIIIIIACERNFSYKFKAFKKERKAIYICNQSSSKSADLYSRHQFDFDFDATESELLFYNCPESNIIKRISLSFKKI